MAHELGVSFSSKPSRKTYTSGIIGRVNESVMLSRNTNLTQPRSQSALPESELEPPKENSTGWTRPLMSVPKDV
jgi:hypothetical protein